MAGVQKVVGRKKKLYVDKKTGKPFEQRLGSRVQVKRGIACMTNGNLRAADIVVTNDGRYVAKSRHLNGKKHGLERLAAAGYAPFAKGLPGVVRRVRKTKAKA